MTTSMAGSQLLEKNTVPSLTPVASQETQPTSELSAAPMASIEIAKSGRIQMPGIPAGLSLDAYFPLVHLYANVLEASRLLDRFRPWLSLAEGVEGQAPLTPLEASPSRENLYYKREDLTATRAYKLRGAVVGMAQMMERGGYQGFLAVSTGNHALGVLKAAELLKPRSVRIVVPKNTAETKLEKIRNKVRELAALSVDAQLVFAGETFDEARHWAMSQRDEREYYLDPYCDPWVVAGQGTIGLELFHQLVPVLQASEAEELVVIAPVGGGGLLAGTATALKMAAAWDPRFRHLKVQCVGLQLDSLEAPLGDAIRVQQVGESNAHLLETLQVPLLPLSNADMAAGMELVHNDLGVWVEGASGGTVIPTLMLSEYEPNARRIVVSLLSGGNVSCPLD